MGFGQNKLGVHALCWVGGWSEAEARKAIEGTARVGYGLIEIPALDPDKIDAGMTVVNDYGLAYMMQDLPFGGVKISGVGKINGREGLRACCNAKAVVRDRLPIRKGIALYPVREATEPLVNEAIRAIYSRGPIAKAKAAFGVARALVELARG